MSTKSPKCPGCGQEEMVPILRTAYYLDYSVMCTNCGKISSLREVVQAESHPQLEISSSPFD